MIDIFAVSIGVVFVVALAVAVKWAHRCSRVRRARELESVHPHCPHGARIFGVGCEKCREETRAFFEESDKPYPKDFIKPGPDDMVIKAAFGAPGDRSNKRKADWPFAMGAVYLGPGGWKLISATERDKAFYVCQGCEYKVTEQDLWAHTDSRTAFAHVCPATLPQRYCAEPNCSYKQPVHQAWLHFCAPRGFLSRWR